MAHITSVTVTNGIPTAGTGDVYTIDQLLAQLSAGNATGATASFTSGTTAYAVRDAVGASAAAAALQFASMGTSTQRVMITSLSLEIDRAALISGEANYTLHLYNVTPPSAINDSAAWDLPSGDRASYLGNIAIPIPVDLGSTLYVEVNAINKVIKLAGTDIFAYLVTEAAYTPTAAVHKITLYALNI